MIEYIKFIKTNINNLAKAFEIKKITYILIFLAGALPMSCQVSRSEEIYLTCSGKFEINRGALIKPDWEIMNLIIKLDGLKSTIVDEEIKTEGRTFIRRNNYTIRQRDNRNKVKKIYNINLTYGTFKVEYPQINRTLIGTCEKGRG